MISDGFKFYLGRAVSWLESIHAAGLGGEEGRPKIKKVIDDIHASPTDVFHFGKAISWLEALGAGLPEADSERVFKLLSEMKSLQEQFLSSSK
jgi:hypothetical protein